MANRTRFAGWFNAADYAYGCGGNFPAPLLVGIGNAATGAGTVNLQFGQTTLSDGTIIFPLNTNAPVTIGSATNAETVTPSAVSNPALSNIYNSSSMTATFANLHGSGDPLSSASFGLQEAINDASSRGGGTVVVDYVWTALGGTAAILATAQGTLPAGVTILDNRAGAGGGVRIASGTISNALVLTLNTVAQLIIPPQGAGTYIDVIDLFLENNNAGVAYAGSPGVIALAYQAAGAATQTYLAAPTIAATFLTSPTVPTLIRSVGLEASVASSHVVNVGCYLSVLTNNPTTGTGDLRYRVTYVVHSGL